MTFDFKLPEHRVIIPSNYRRKSPQVRRFRESVLRSIYAGRLGIGNYFRLEAFNHTDGRSRWLTPWFHNNITNGGLDMCGTTSTRYDACKVGTGNTAPDDDDTTLETFLAESTSLTVLGGTVSGAPLYYTERRIRYNFATGAVVGNITEVAVGPAGSGSPVFSRELVRDAVGDPAAASLTAQETLRVHYRIRHYPDVDDVVGTVNGNIRGVPTSIGYTRRGMYLNNQPFWAPFSYNNAGNDVTAVVMGTPQTSTAAGVGDDPINTITGGYPGAVLGDGPSSIDVASYTPGSLTRTFSTEWETGEANFDIQSVWFRADSGHGGSGTRYAHGGNWQVGLDTVIDKTNLDVLQMEFSISWDRYIEP